MFLGLLMLLSSYSGYQVQGNTAQEIRIIQPVVQTERLQGNEGEGNILVNYEAGDTLQTTVYGAFIQ